MGGILWQLPLHGEEGIALQDDRVLQQYPVALAEIAEPVLVETGRDRFAVRRRPGLVEECPGVMGDLIKLLRVIGVALGPCLVSRISFN